MGFPLLEVAGDVHNLPNMIPLPLFGKEVVSSNLNLKIWVQRTTQWERGRAMSFPQKRRRRNRKENTVHKLVQ